MIRVFPEHHLIKISAIHHKTLRKLGLGMVLCLWLAGTGLAMWLFNPIPGATSVACHTQFKFSANN